MCIRDSFITAGDPDLSVTEALVPAMAEAGADLIELGIPFSDPVDKMAVFAVLMRLREICCDPRLIADNWEGGSAKLDACVELVLSLIHISMCIRDRNKTSKMICSWNR